MKKLPMCIGVLGFDGVNALDLVGPMEAFANANDLAKMEGLREPYRLVVIGRSRRAFSAESGVTFHPHCDFRTAPPLHTLIVPGGAGLREPATNAVMARWIGAQAPKLRRLVSVCTGAFGIAPTGLLDGRRVTTHWRQAPLLAQRYPALKVDGKALFVRDGKYYTGGGITAGIDLALALIEEDLGPRMSLAVAREMVVYLKRPGGQEQYSEPLRAQVRGSDRFADLVAWIDGHLDTDLSVEALAQRACLSPRHFSRRFGASFGCTPADYVEDARMGEARRRLAQGAQTLESIATAVGYGGADVFRRAFERRFGIGPRQYRERFGMSQASIH